MAIRQSIPDVRASLHRRDLVGLRESLKNWPPPDLAELLDEASVEDEVVLFRILPRKLAAETFAYLTPRQQERLLKAMAKEEVTTILNSMPDDDRTLLLEEMPAGATKQLLALLTPEESAAALKQLGYLEGTIGRLMTPHYVAVREEWTVQYVLDYIREHGQDSETLSMIYVVDEKGVLIDDIRIRNFLLAPLTAKVSDNMDYRYVALKAADSQQSAVQIFKEQDRKALPVTDSAGELIGIVTIDDVLNVAEEAATREIQKIGGSEALDEPYMQISFAKLVKKRAGWLIILFVGEMLTATAMGFFEKEIERAVVLALFVPLIISSGGNSGSQASTLVIRALALGEVKLREWWRVARRELFSGLALGGILGGHRLLPHRGMVAFLQYLWPTLATGRADGRTSAHRHRPLGDARRFDAALHPAAPWLRPRDFFRPVRRHARRRHGPGDLLQCGSGDLTWRAPLREWRLPRGSSARFGGR